MGGGYMTLVPFVPDDLFETINSKNHKSDWKFEVGAELLNTIYKAMIDKNPYSIKFIENPTEEIQLYAVGKNKLSINFIKNPTDKVWENAGMKKPRDYDPEWRNKI